ncbi:uncharacterized protein DDB_G0271670-like [Nilaparvata lugens]|uniref:uncharacterized protein DDB_G0271670-like n=1 Tax=Nilaparvata lugens TaxID=108931 RepID=UPI00193CA775|nr:uncharacterized protein DDB_G0271670-like [Nilaparvata lugens]
MGLSIILVNIIIITSALTSDGYCVRDCCCIECCTYPWIHHHPCHAYEYQYPRACPPPFYNPPVGETSISPFNLPLGLDETVLEVLKNLTKTVPKSLASLSLSQSSSFQSSSSSSSESSSSSSQSGSAFGSASGSAFGSAIGSPYGSASGSFSYHY